MMVQCMGAWCKAREHCCHYYAMPIPGREPVDRLCGDVEEPEPLGEREKLIKKFPTLRTWPGADNE